MLAALISTTPTFVSFHYVRTRCLSRPGSLAIWILSSRPFCVLLQITRTPVGACMLCLSTRAGLDAGDPLTLRLLVEMDRRVRSQSGLAKARSSPYSLVSSSVLFVTITSDGGSAVRSFLSGSCSCGLISCTCLAMDPQKRNGKCWLPCHIGNGFNLLPLALMAA